MGIRRLYLLRHAKSDWDASHHTDRDRPLNKRGRGAARVIGRFLAQIDEIPEVVRTSPATRARTTAQIAVEAGSWSRPVEEEPRLYEARVDEMLDVVRDCQDDAGSLLIVGHDPVGPQFLQRMVGGGAFRIPTAAVARMDLGVRSWRETAFGDATLRWLVTPKLLAKVRDAPPE